MTIEEQQEAIGEAWAERRYNQWRAVSVDLAVGVGYEYADLPELAKDEWRVKAVNDLAFLTEKGAVLKVETPKTITEDSETWNVTVDVPDWLTATAPLMEKK